MDEILNQAPGHNLGELPSFVTVSDWVLLKAVPIPYIVPRYKYSMDYIKSLSASFASSTSILLTLSDIYPRGVSPQIRSAAAILFI